VWALIWLIEPEPKDKKDKKDGKDEVEVSLREVTRRCW
jgi:hypothetical protein